MALADVILATQSANLKGYYPCNDAVGSLVLADASGNGKDLTLTGSAGSSYTLEQAGHVGNAISFAGTNGYASRTDSIVGSPLDHFTLAMLVKGASQSGSRLCAFGSSSDTDPILNLQSDGTGVLGFIRDSVNVTQYLNGGGTVFDNNWHFVVFRWDGTNIQVMVDNAVVHTEPMASLTALSLNRTALGCLLRNSASSFFNGSIQHYAAWDTGLTNGELTAIFAEMGDAPVAAMSHNFGVGGVSDTSAKYRAKADRACTLKLKYSTASDLSDSTTSTGVAVVTGDNFCGGEVITGLTPNTIYYYSVLADDVEQHEAPFPSFRTLPAEGVDADLRIAFGSCLDSGTGDVYTSIAGEAPHLIITLGDFGYIDSDSLSDHRNDIAALFTNDLQSEVVNRIPMEKMPDDHDLVGNNCHGDSSGMSNAKQAWLEIHPRHDLANQAGGLWRSFAIGNCDVFMLDTRFQREGTQERFPASGTNAADTGSSGNSLVIAEADSPSGSDDYYKGWYVLIEGEYRRVTSYVAATRTCTLDKPVAAMSASSTYFLKRASMLDQDALADDQVDWLISGINASAKRWKVICSPVVWNPTVDQGQDDDVWGDWDSEQMEANYLKQEIVAENIIVLSADRHWSAIDDGTNSHWPEATASPINRNTYLSNVAGTWSNGARNNALQYGVLEIDGTAHTATLTIKQANGTSSTQTPLVIEDATYTAPIAYLGSQPITKMYLGSQLVTATH